MDKRFPLEDQIEMLATALRGRVILPRHADYDATRMVALANFDRRPAALVRVANATDVAAVLNFAQATELAVAVRSGGHSTMGFGGCDGGLVIDLRDLNTIDIDPVAKTAWVGTGLTAGEVTAAVEKHGLVIGFGDTGTVGLGGLTLGGGIGYMVRKFGLTIDNLLAAEVVTASGDILVADEAHHRELFWALRGGGGNFGVVTRLKFKLNDLPQFVGGPLVLPPRADVLAGFMAAAQAAPDELTTIGFLMPIPPVPVVPPEAHGKLALIAMMAYAGNPDGAARAIAPFRALATPLADLVRPAPLSSLYALDPPPEMRSSVSIRSRFVDGIDVAAAHNILTAIERCEAPMKMVQLRALGGAFGRVPQDATAFAHRDAKAMVAFLAMYGGGPDVTAHFERWAQAAMDSVPSTGSAYVNFLADEGKDGLAAAYPAATLSRLRQVKRMYDPENLFRLNQNIAPAA
jgi:FAD/FMN-containing dehydrogenase